MKPGDAAMNRDLNSDFDLIDPRAKTHEAWSAFVFAMRGREYGREPLNSAWLWFRDGWDASHDPPAEPVKPAPSAETLDECSCGHTVDGADGKCACCRRKGAPSTETTCKTCPSWCATYDPLDMSSAMDGDRRYHCNDCRSAGRCLRP